MGFLFIRTTWLALGEQETLLISEPQFGLLHCCASQVQISWVLLTHTYSKYLSRKPQLQRLGSAWGLRCCVCAEICSHFPVPQVPIQVKLMGGGKRGKTTAHSSGATFSLTCLKCFPKAGRLLKGKLLSVVTYHVAEP